MFRHFVPSKELHFLVTLVHLSLVDLLAANSMKCCSPPASLKVNTSEFAEEYMDWLNIFGLIMIAVIMIPNIIFAIRCKKGFENKWSNKFIEIAEQIGRFGCFGFTIINIPGTWFGWWSDEAFAIYLIVDIILVVLYCAIWIICFKKSSIFRALALSVIPSVLFLFNGIMSRSILLLIAAILFAPSHILLSYKNAK